ncbi:glycoside hydrolase family 18 protein [Russula earlei]|uniref:Glycoside hydrolase family 18 protein n=1 Tax=Russula earlei TaxID=71964 RepID=A0ACC0TXF8_9AGAM|nr:glycoside hydrolase family 18 protein [Russula earlei]
MFLLAPLIFITAQLARAAPSCSLTSSAPPSTSTIGAPGCSTNNSISKQVVAATWYAGWHSSDFPLQDLSWNKYTTVIYAFASTTPDSSVLGLGDADKTLLLEFVSNAHANGVHAMLSVGGWGGSQYFSSAVATDANRTAFAQAVLAAVSQYNLDGIEFDWEYPNKQGMGCNVVSANDTANFLSFLQTLRGMNGAKNITLSAAVSVLPFIGPDGNPVSDVTGFANVLDHIEIMNYDIWGSWDSTVGPNAPLNDSCAPSPEGSAVSAVKAWSTAGFPADRIILGVASYGHSFHVANTDALDASGNIKLNPPFDKSQQPAGDKWDSTAGGVDACGNPNVVGGLFDFWGLVTGGFLANDGTAATGIDYTFDNCSMTPYVYNPTTQVMVSFDDATSFAAKGKYIDAAGLAGFAMWEAAGDLNDTLLDGIRSGIGMGC